MRRGDFRRLAGADLLDDRLHGERGSARIQAVAEERAGLLEDDLIDCLDVRQFRVSAFGLVEFFDQPEARQLREIRLPARALDDRLGDFLRHGVIGKAFADEDRLPQQSDGYVAILRLQPQFARTDEGVIPQRPEFLERRIPRDQQPHSATVLNGRPQQPHQLDEWLLGLRFLSGDFFESHSPNAVFDGIASLPIISLAATYRNLLRLHTGGVEMSKTWKKRGICEDRCQ